MTKIVGTLKDSAGILWSGELEVTLDSELIDTSTAPDSVYFTSKRIFTVTNGGLILNLAESQTSNLTYRFLFNTITKSIQYYYQDGALYAGPTHQHTDSFYYTGSTHTNDSRLLSRIETNISTPLFDFRAIVPNVAEVEFAALLPTGITTDVLDSSVRRIADLLTSNVNYVEALRGGPQFKGAYRSTTFYQRNNAVSYAGSSWIYIFDTPTAGNTPTDANSTYWFKLAAKGDAGGTGGNDTAYNATGWSGATDAPSRNAVRNIIEQLARTSQLASYALLNSPTFSNPRANTQPVENDSTLIANTQFVNAALQAAGTLPVGAIIDWVTNSPPSKWILLDGRAISRTTYTALFNIIGTTFGEGDGTTTFNIPDFRGRTSVGLDNMNTAVGAANRVGTLSSLGNTTGASSRTLSINEMPAHTHPQNVSAIANSGGTGTRQDFTADATGLSSLSQGISTSSTGGGQAFSLMQPSIAINKIIYAGV